MFRGSERAGDQRSRDSVSTVIVVYCVGDIFDVVYDVVLSDQV